MVAGGIHDYIWFELVFVFFMVVNGSTMEKCLSMNHRGLASGYCSHGKVTWSILSQSR
jgi:hypothetical protein